MEPVFKEKHMKYFVTQLNIQRKIHGSMDEQRKEEEKIRDRY